MPGGSASGLVLATRSEEFFVKLLGCFKAGVRAGDDDRAGDDLRAGDAVRLGDDGWAGEDAVGVRRRAGGMPSSRLLGDAGKRSARSRYLQNDTMQLSLITRYNYRHPRYRY